MSEDKNIPPEKNANDKCLPVEENWYPEKLLIGQWKII